MGKKRRSKTESPPAIDRLLYPAIGATVAFLAYYFMKGISADVSSFVIHFYLLVLVLVFVLLCATNTVQYFRYMLCIHLFLLFVVFHTHVRRYLLFPF